MIQFLFKGLVMGLIVALPVGPVGILCLNRAMSRGFRTGLASGLGAALGDTLYALAAALGLTLIKSFLLAHHELFEIAGGLLVAGIGLHLLRGRDADAPGDGPGKNLVADAGSMFLAATANPGNLLAFMAACAAAGLGRAHTTPAHAMLLACGVFCGSMLWWLAVALAGSRLRSRMGRRVPGIRRASGLLILAVGLGAAAWQII